jgi:transcriptional regulator with XRE-family HTH domain
MRDWTTDEIRSMAERLRRARLEAGYSRATEAVRKFGWNYSRYMNYENGERAIPPKQAILFAAAYAVTIDYIYFGNEDDVNQIPRKEALFSRLVRRISLVALEDIAEMQRIASGLEPVATGTVPVSDDKSIPEHVIFIEVADRSMSNPNEPVSFEIGDRVLIDLKERPAPSDFVLALVPGESAALFRLYREVGLGEDGSIIVNLVPLNPNFRTIAISKEHPGHIIGVCRRLYRVFEL